MTVLRSIDARVTGGLDHLRRWRKFAFGWLQLGLRPTDLVLEVGCGQKPKVRSDVLCDKFLGDSTERDGQPLVVDRPLVVADAQRLPFRDKAFDFVYSSHLVEHLDDPGRFCEEIMRVGNRGSSPVRASSPRNSSDGPLQMVRPARAGHTRVRTEGPADLRRAVLGLLP